MVSRVLATILRFRVVVIVVYALLVPAAAYLATRIPSRGAIDQLIVPGDPDYAATRAFQAIFPESQTALFVLEAKDPWSTAALERVQRAGAALASVPDVSSFSVLDALRQVRRGADAETLRRLATGTTFFRRQGLVGDDFMTLVASLDVRSSAERDNALAAIDAALALARI